MKRGPDFFLFALLWALAIWLGCTLRLDGVASSPLFGDEHHTLTEVGKSYGEIFASFGSWGSHASLPLMQKLCLDMLGPGVVSLRLPALVPGLLVLLLVFPLARGIVGQVPALVATWAVAVAPMLVYYTHFARSYALAVLLALGLVHFVARALAADPSRAKTGTWIGAGVCAALLPWAHLSTLGFVVGVGIAACGVAWRRTGSWRDARAPIATFGAAALACALLFWPAREAVRAYLDKVAGGAGVAGDVGVLDVTTLLFGGFWMGVLGLPLLLVAAFRFVRAKPAVGVLVVAGLAGLLVSFLISRPYGMAYAYARYFVVALPFVWMLIAWLGVEFVRWRRGGNARPALSLGILACLGLYWSGPLAPTRLDTESFGNSYLAMRALPAFDVPSLSIPVIYGKLGGDDIIEVPALTTRSALLYRNYALQHGGGVSIGTYGTTPASMKVAPYVSVLDVEAVRATGAGYLMLHRDAAAETAAYWRFVYDAAWPALPTGRCGHDASFMARQERFAPPAPIPAQLEPRLRHLYGRPVFEDAVILAWQL